MTFLLTCIIPGTPQPQGSKRNVGGNRFIEANRNLAPWRADAIAYLQAEWRGRGPITEPVSLDVAFDFARPASHYGTGRNAGVLKDSAPGGKATAPDLDKLCRALGDALTQSGVLRDDALIVEWVARKQWASKPSTWLQDHQHQLSATREHLHPFTRGQVLPDVQCGSTQALRG